MEIVPELEVAQGMGQGPYHHLDVLGHTLEVVGWIEQELEEGRLGAIIRQDRLDALRLVGLLHDIAKPLTRGEYEGKVMFVAHDTLGARLTHRICRRLNVGAETTDLVTSLTALHLKIGFMGNPRTDYPPRRLVRAAGPFGEELAVLSWADRLAAQGPRLNDEHIERHRVLCEEFLIASREGGLYETPEYEDLAYELDLTSGADTGYAAASLRLLEARGLGRKEALRYV